MLLVVTISIHIHSLIWVWSIIISGSWRRQLSLSSIILRRIAAIKWQAGFFGQCLLALHHFAWERSTIFNVKPCSQNLRIIDCELYIVRIRIFGWFWWNIRWIYARFYSIGNLVMYFLWNSVFFMISFYLIWLSFH